MRVKIRKEGRRLLYVGLRTVVLWSMRAYAGPRAGGQVWVVGDDGAVPSAHGTYDRFRAACMRARTLAGQNIAERLGEKWDNAGDGAMAACVVAEAAVTGTTERPTRYGEIRRMPDGSLLELFTDTARLGGGAWIAPVPEVGGAVTEAWG